MTLTVEERLDKLERQNHWLRGGMALAVSLSVATLAVRLPASAEAQSVPKVVYAESFAVYKDGQVRALLAVDPQSSDSQLTLTAFGQTNRVPYVVLSAGKDGTKFNLNDATGTGAGSIIMGTAGGPPSLSLYNKSSYPGVSMLAMPDGSGQAYVTTAGGPPGLNVITAGPGAQTIWSAP